MPFCVLDEVDAALDEANVGRFSTALRGLAEQTQFIVITHNRGTIEARRRALRRHDRRRRGQPRGLAAPAGRSADADGPEGPAPSTTQPMRRGGTEPDRPTS